MSMKNVLKDVYSTIVRGGLSKTQDIQFGMESLNVENGGLSAGKGAEEGFKGLKEEFNSLLTNIQVSKVDEYGTDVGFEDYSSALTKAQKKAGLMVLATQRNQKEAFERSLKLETPQAGSVVSQESYRDLDILNLQDLKVSAEAFDAAKNDNSVYFSMIVNMGIAKQSQFVEAWMPNVMIKPYETGCRAVVKLTSFIQDYVRDRSVDKLGSELLGRKSIIKNLFNRDIMTQDRTKVIPVFHNDTKSKLMDEAYSTVTTETGTAIKTAPYLFNTKFDILRLSQTDKSLAQGTMDNTDQLLPHVRIMKVFFEVKTANKTNMFKADVSRLAGSTFGFIGQGHFKDLNCQMNDQIIAIRLGETLTATGAQQDFGTDIAATTTVKDFTVQFAFSLSGKINMQTGDTEVFGNSISVKRIFNAAGQEIDLTSGQGQTILAAITGITLVGYELEAYRSNTNIRTLGQAIQFDELTRLYTCPFRSPASVAGPISDYTGEKNDFDEIQNLITIINAASDYNGVQELVNFVADLEARSINPKEDDDFTNSSINKHLVNFYFNKDTIDLSKAVDSIESHDRMLDIQSTLLNNITQKALDMYIESNYKVAFEAMYGQSGKKATILIGTDPILKYYICYGKEGNVFPLNDELDIMVVSTVNPLMKGQLFMSFSVGSNIGEIDSITPLHPGWRQYSPAITLTIDAMPLNGALSKRAMVIPRYKHHMDLEVMTKIDVINIPDVLKKVTVYMQ